VDCGNVAPCCRSTRERRSQPERFTLNCAKFGESWGQRRISLRQMGGRERSWMRGIPERGDEVQRAVHWCGDGIDCPCNFCAESVRCLLWGEPGVCKVPGELGAAQDFAEANGRTGAARDEGNSRKGTTRFSGQYVGAGMASIVLVIPALRDSAACYGVNLACAKFRGGHCPEGPGLCSFRWADPALRVLRFRSAGSVLRAL
jgi:hypothetical protein